MKFVNFARGERRSFGVVVADGVLDLKARLATEARDLTELIRSDVLAPGRTIARAASADYPLSDVRLLSPAGRHARFFCIGVNYPERNEEYKDGSERPKYPSVFMRTHTSFSAHEEPILRPQESEQLDYEGEIALVIGTEGRRIAERDAWRHVAGLSLMNEGSVRDWLRHSKFNVTPGKNFERSGAVGPWLVSADEFRDGQEFHLTTRVNGEVRQDDTTTNLIFSFARLIAYLSSFMRLLPGDVIATGTPTGAGARFDPPKYLKAGDVVEVNVPGIGTLENRVVDD